MYMYSNTYTYIYVQEGCTALMKASVNGQASIVSLLLFNTNIDINKQDKVNTNIYIYLTINIVL